MGKIVYIGIWLMCCQLLTAQSAFVTGHVRLEKSPALYANVFCNELGIGAQTDEQGMYRLGPLPPGRHIITSTYVGYGTLSFPIEVGLKDTLIYLDFELESQTVLNEVVVSGSRTFQRKDNSPVLVNVLTRQTMENVQACHVADGLRFQPGLRVETDCQTCNYTQLRMNGLGGGYSQILINGRPVFSPLTGLYGLEQIPASILERIEVVRGGASSIYGPGAIGGTVNIITRPPSASGVEAAYTWQTIHSRTMDHNVHAAVSLVNKPQTAGISVLMNHRNRGFYDHNSDNFSELPALSNTSVGITTFWQPDPDQKLEINAMGLHEYRLGGDMSGRDIPLLLQAEERTHGVGMVNLDHQINFNEGRSSIISFVAMQKTVRDHYTGIFPDLEVDIEQHLEAPPFGHSQVITINGGLQWNHRPEKFLKGKNTFTAGVEYTYDKVEDHIAAYRYNIDQKTKDLGLFVQSDWQVQSRFTILTGLRADWHNRMQSMRWSPRVSLMYKFKPMFQLRINAGTGFRPPQAFDTDLHLAFAGGGISRIGLASDLGPETSQSLSFSLNYDKATERAIAGFTLESFYTRLQHSFYLHPIGNDGQGEIFEKRNGSGAMVRGVIVELRFNYNRKLQVETGMTWQQSLFDRAIPIMEGVPATRTFMRTPSTYGFATASVNFNSALSLQLGYLYTGTMLVPHFAGAPEQLTDQIVSTNTFHEFSSRINWSLAGFKSSNLVFFAGVKNLFNAFQNDFDTGKNRDSNYIYGPAIPQTFFAGVKWTYKNPTIK